MEKPSLFICGAVRNCEPYLDIAFENIERIATLFSDAHIIMAFDESDDHTLLKLTQRKKKYGDKMDILINKDPLSHIRTERIANARNRLLAKMRELPERPYFIMMDMDDACSFETNLEPIEHALNQSSEWDSISFNRPNYYDLWALSLDPYIYSCWGWTDPWNVVDIMREYVSKRLKELKPGELLECRSAFNGLAIYKTDPFLKCKYDWRMPKQYMSLEDLRKNCEVLGNRRSNSPFDQFTDESDCEHRSFHMEAIAKYGARIRISPECIFDQLFVHF